MRLLILKTMNHPVFCESCYCFVWACDRVPSNSRVWIIPLTVTKKHIKLSVFSSGGFSLFSKSCFPPVLLYNRRAVGSMQELGEGVEFLRVWSWAGPALWTQAGFTGHLGPWSYSIAAQKTRTGALVKVSQDSHLLSVFHAEIR